MKQSISSKVFDSILNDVLGDRYKPGQILTERELMEKYGCSKTTVREALVGLCRERIVRNIPRCGYEVVRIEAREIRDMLEYRYILEKGCLELAWEHIGPAEIDHLRKLNALCCDAMPETDLWSHWEANKTFHLALVLLSHNHFAHDSLSSTMDILKRAYAQYYWNKWTRSVVATDIRNHAVLLDALERRDLDAAIRALHDDLDDFAY